MVMMYVTIMTVSLMLFGSIIFLVYLHNQKTMYFESVKLAEKLWEPIIKLTDVMVKYFESEMNDDYEG